MSESRSTNLPNSTCLLGVEEDFFVLLDLFVLFFRDYFKYQFCLLTGNMEQSSKKRRSTDND